jgi:hypothetical protein
MVFDLTIFQPTSNLALTGPSRLTLEQFHALPVPYEVSRARSLIYGLEAFINSTIDAGRIDENTLTPVHRFSNGVYTRELTMPTGTIIVGKRHAQEHLVTMIKGFCTCYTERGQEDLYGFNSFHSPAGEKRVLFIHEETTWITTHRTDATDLAAVENDLILKEQSLFPHKYKKQIVE